MRPDRARNPADSAIRRVARFVLERSAVAHHPRPPSVLVLARPGPEGDDLFAELARRADLTLLRVANAAAASLAIRELAVALVVACPDTATAEIDSVLVLPRRGAARHAGARHPRRGRSPTPGGWSARGVAVLRMPLLPDVLSRSVDVVLGMKQGG